MYLDYNTINVRAKCLNQLCMLVRILNEILVELPNALRFHFVSKMTFTGPAVAYDECYLRHQIVMCPRVHDRTSRIAQREFGDHHLNENTCWHCDLVNLLESNQPLPLADFIELLNRHDHQIVLTLISMKETLAPVLTTGDVDRM